jgi:DNA-binding response OmpR family regulator
MPLTQILLADDEPDLVWAVQQNLCAEGYEVLVAYDGEEALALARLHHPDLIVLDIVMPRLDGLRVCHRLRQDPDLAAVPILFLTERSAIEDRVRGLEGGGDDYVAKPFDLRELKARIRVLLRRSRPATEGSQGLEAQRPMLRVGSLTLDLNVCQVHIEERTAQLTPTQFDLLRYLMTHPGEVFSSQQLLCNVWQYPPGTADPSLVRWHVKNLRAKIEPDPAAPVYICYVSHHGYLLAAGGPSHERSLPHR